MIVTASTLPIVFSAGVYDSRTQFTKESDGALSKLRTVAEYEIELFTEDGGCSHINGSSFPIKRGYVLFSCPGDKRRSTLHFKSHFVHFGCNDERIAEIISHIPKFSFVSDTEKYISIFSDIISVSKSLSNYSDIAASAKLMFLIYTLHGDTFCNPAADFDKSCGKASVANAIDYIKKHYSDPITVDDIAASCNLSPSYFHRLFLKAAMESPNKYLLNTRLAAARTVLTTDSLPISAIAENCGFNSQAYFCYCFKKAFGMTPKEYRERFGYGFL